MDLIEKFVKKEIRELQRIKDTFDERFNYYRLDKNERLCPFPDSIIQEIAHRITFESLSGYWELGPFYRKLAHYLGVNEDEVLLTAGSDLAIRSVYETLVSPGDELIMHLPTYAMYRVYARMFGAHAHTVSLTKDWRVDFQSMLAHVNDKTRFVVLENPNGFVGIKPSDKEIEEFVQEMQRRNVFVLLDEVYIYVTQQLSSWIKQIQKYPNLIIVQSFSKVHGLAGLRVGFAIAHKEVMKYLSRVRPMHEITSVSCIASEVILDHPELMDCFRNEVKESKEFIRKELESMQIGFRDTATNFILAYLPQEGRTRDMEARFKKKKILIRRPFTEEFLRGWSRVAVGNMEMAQVFISTLKQILGSSI